MNFLGHACFSPNDAAVLTGNMISDFVKGNAQFSYPEKVQQGIDLHRSIDAFIDHHAAAKAARAVFRADYRLYAGAFVDVAFDYFVANDSSLFANESALFSFSQQVYANLDGFTPIMPGQFTRMFIYMRQQNWLYNYRFPDGMRQSFGGLVRRSAYLNDSETAYTLFMNNLSFLQECYTGFMTDFSPWHKNWLLQSGFAARN